MAYSLPLCLLYFLAMDYSLFELLEMFGRFRIFMTKREHEKLCSLVLLTLAGHEVEPDPNCLSGKLFIIWSPRLNKINLMRKKQIEGRNKTKQ